MIRRFERTVATSLLFWCLASCNHTSEKKIAPAASSMGARTPPSALTESPSGTVRYAFSSASRESSIVFRVNAAGIEQSGSFGTFEGVILVPNGALKQASVVVDIDVRSLRTANAELTSELKSSHFLDTERYPSAHFGSTTVDSGGALGATNTVKGTLQLRGVTREIEIPGTLHVRANGIDVDAEFPVHRRDFGLRFAGERDATVEDEIVISLVVVAYPAS